MHVFVLYQTYEHTRFSCHTRMRGILTEGAAINTVASIGRYAPNHVTGVYIFEVDLQARLLHVFFDLCFEKRTDVKQPYISRSIFLNGVVCLAHDFLASSFCDEDHAM